MFLLICWLSYMMFTNNFIFGIYWTNSLISILGGIFVLSWWNCIILSSVCLQTWLVIVSILFRFCNGSTNLKHSSSSWDNTVQDMLDNANSSTPNIIFAPGDLDLKTLLAFNMCYSWVCQPFPKASTFLILSSILKEFAVNL